MSDDTPFHVWMNTAVNEMAAALQLDNDTRRVHLFKCFDALMWAMEEVVKAHKE